MKKIAKSKGVMISSIISLLLSLIVLAAVSMAWLSMNTVTESNGMKLKVEVSPNLIIDGDKKDDDPGDGADRLSEVVGPTANNFSITFDQNVVALRPATHDSTYGTYTKGLKYVTNQQNVNASSGVASGAVYSDAVNVVGPPAKNYYVDYTVYIASTGAEMPITSLTVEILSARCTIGGVSSSGNATLQAASIDFYEGTPASGTYKGTLNVAGLTHSSNSNGIYNAGATTLSIDLTDREAIPYNRAASNNHITITMRCYFDGALSSGSGTTYINTATVDTSDVELVVKFTATANY
ncbi:MAG: hypothetical protein K6F14_07985 [Clostridiales bacterium]|nr:hypothetical protein [Clostridiales bacterium]